MFTVLIVQPIFNLLVLIYALLPGHNFGLAIILFTVFVRLLLWPLVKRQLHHAKAIRALQPEVKKIKAATKGDRQKESRMLMELYRERQINPFASLGIMLLQLPILIGLYFALKRLIDDPQQIVSFGYPFVEGLGWIQNLARDISQFDPTLFGLVDLSRKALENGGVYWPAMLLVAASAVAQYFQSKQLLPRDKDARGLRQILRDAGKGKSADQSEVNAAVGRGTIYLIPFFVFIVSLGLPAGLPLYWLATAVIAIIQQSIILREDVEEMGSKTRLAAGQTAELAPGAEASATTAAPKPKRSKKRNKSSKKNKRRKR